MSALRMAEITETLQAAVIDALRDAVIHVEPLGGFRVTIYQTAEGRHLEKRGEGDQWSGSLRTPWTFRHQFPGDDDEFRALHLLGGGEGRNPLWKPLPLVDSRKAAAQAAMAALGQLLPYSPLMDLLMLKEQIGFTE